MKFTLSTLFVLCTLVLVLFAADVEACSCVRRETCQYAASADAVFIGKVVSQTEIARKNPQHGFEERYQISRLSVVENFLGTEQGNEISVQSDISTSCAFPLAEGETYVVYAGRSSSEGVLVTGMCSGTKPVADAEKEIEMLRDDRGKLSSVSGSVEFENAGKMNPQRLKEFGVNTVRLIGEGGSQETKLDRDGTFRFRGIPAGEYRIEAVLPDSLMTEGDYHPDVAEDLGIKDQRLFTVSGVGCFYKLLRIRENGRIGGRLVDDQGNPIEGVQVTAVPIGKDGRPVKQEELCYDTGLCISSREDGTYLLQGLKPGRYLIGTRLGRYVCNNCVDAEYSKTFYPGVPTEVRAKPIVVGLGKHVENIDLKLIDKYSERQITGIVVFKDGRPAGKVAVRYVARTPDFKQNSITFIETDSDGSFTIDGYDDHSYLIGAFTDNRHGNERADAKAVVVNISPRRSVPSVRLVLDQASTNDDFTDFPTRRPGRKKN